MAAPATRHHLARPPYVDPTTNIIYDTDSPEYEGWLTKQSMWLKVSEEEEDEEEESLKDYVLLARIGHGGEKKDASCCENVSCQFRSHFLILLFQFLLLVDRIGDDDFLFSREVNYFLERMNIPVPME
jgi:hypothetical protein